MRFFVITLGNEDSSCIVYVNANRIEYSNNTYTKKLAYITFYVGTKQICFVDSYRVYRVEEIIGDDELKVLFQEGKILC